MSKLNEELMKIIACSFLAVLMAGGMASAQQPSEPEKGKSAQSVTTEDGKKYFGIITIKDDYTIRIESDSGIANVPIAALQGDTWKKYSKDDERKDDGRFWSERKEVLVLKWEKNGGQGSLEQALEVIEPYLPAIKTFEQTKKTDDQAAAAKPKPGALPEAAASASPKSAVEIRLFSGPGALGLGAPPATVGDVMKQVPSSVPQLP